MVGQQVARWESSSDFGPHLRRALAHASNKGAASPSVRAREPLLIQVQRHLRCCTVQSWNGSILTSAETRSRGAAPPEKLGRCTGDREEGLPHATSALGPQNDSLPMLCCWPPECFFLQCGAVWGRQYTQPVLNLPTGALLHRPKK